MQRYTMRIGFAYAFLCGLVSFVDMSLVWAQKGGIQSRHSVQSMRREVVCFALKHNRDLGLFRVQLKRAKALHVAARVFPSNPVLSVGGGAQFPVPQVPAVGGVLPQVGVGLSLALPVGGRWQRLQDVAASRKQYVSMLLGARQFQLTMKVHEQLNRLAFAFQMLEKRRKMVSFYGKMESLTRRRMKLGAATLHDLGLVQLTGIRARQSALEAVSQLRLEKQGLKRLLGWSATKQLRWSLSTLPGVPSGKKMVQAWERGQKRHRLLRLAKAKVKQAHAGLALAKARAIPDLTVSLQYALEDNNHIARGSLSIPLPLFWRNQRGIQRQRAMVERAKLVVSRQRFLIRQNVHRARLRFAGQLNMLKLLQRQLRVARKRTSLFSKGVSQGGVSVFQMLATQQLILKTELAYLVQLRRVHESYLALGRATGMGPVYAGVGMHVMKKGGAR